VQETLWGVIRQVDLLIEVLYYMGREVAHIAEVIRAVCEALSVEEHNNEE